MTFEELQLKYENIPIELKQMNRWVGYNIEETEDGKSTKRPYNPIDGARAKVNNDLTWTTFNLAVKGVIKYRFDGIGFVLGDGIFGVDLDNHPGENQVSQEEFDKLVNEFTTSLNSYAERSQSGKGVHIICKGSLPDGRRRKGCIEMYDSNRFFVCTGDVINKSPIQEKSEEIKPLWEKYIYTPVQDQPQQEQKYINHEIYKELTLSDQDVIDTALSSKQGSDFYNFYHDGNISSCGNDHSEADIKFCLMLAFWTNKNKEQMDRIFRNSALMRKKWDEYRGAKTYGQIQIDDACSKTTNTYIKTEFVNNVSIKDKSIPGNWEQKQSSETQEDSFVDDEMNIDENGEPIFHIRKIFAAYSYTDTGNAMLFYDYFGKLFKYNKTDKVFMFWTGKVWIKDTKDIVRKYANKLIELLKDREEEMREQIAELQRNGKTIESKELSAILQSSEKNTARLSNRNGKDAMLFELQSLKDIPLENHDFDTQDYLLNTDSGIVDLTTGEIKGFDREKLMSKKTDAKVSFETPKVWLDFLYSVFDTGDLVRTQEMIDCLQTCLGYSLSGSCKEQVMFLLYGSGSNGKSTLTETVTKILGTYASNIKSSILMQQKVQNNSATYSVAKLQNIRFVETGETDDSGKINESEVKLLTGGDTIAAQFKYGHEFSFRPRFKIWLSTNNRPIIRGTDLGIWRRVFIFPFVNTFTEKQKDKNLPDKLNAEKDKILGWCINGYLKYQKLGDLIVPDAVKVALQDYKKQMDIIAQFIEKECVIDKKYEINSKKLYESYKTWANDNCEWTMKESKFCEELKNKGFVTRKDSSGRTVYIGIQQIGARIG